MGRCASTLRGALTMATPKHRRIPHRPPSAQRGIALVLALWLTVLLTVIASGFAFSMRSEAIAARNAISLAQARAIADGAVERTLYELSRPRLPDAWAPDGRQHKWTYDGAQIFVTAVDETSKIDLNSANEMLLKGLMTQVGELDPEAASRIVDAILDWRDADDLRRPNGAEQADYRAANLKYGPGNAPFESVGEFGRVLGVTPELYERVSRSLTVYSRQAGINPTTAPREVLLALPNATAEMVDRYLVTRMDALDARLPVPFFPPAQGFGVGAVAVWRIRAQAFLPDGVTFIREAVVRPVADVRRPLIVLAWQDGARASAAPPAPDAASTANAESHAR
jgi:general secretion pathway protein K